MDLAWRLDCHIDILLIGFLFIKCFRSMIIDGPKFIGPKFGLHPLFNNFGFADWFSHVWYNRCYSSYAIHCHYKEYL